MTERLAWEPKWPMVCKMYLAGATNHTATGNFRRIPVDSRPIDTHEFGDSSADAFILPKTGIWRVSAHTQFAANATGNRREIRFKVNETYTVGTTPDNVGSIFATHVEQNQSNAAVGLYVADLWKLAKGDSLTFEALQNSGGNLAFATGESLTWMAVYYVGPWNDK